MCDWESLIKLSDEDVAKVDIAEMNLACAGNLNGAENLDAKACLTTLGYWTAWIRIETERNAHRFRQCSGEFNHSWAEYCIGMMMTVAYQDFGIRYDLERMNDEGEWHDAADSFIHGVIQKQCGTCASLPVFYVALGRRLGYPLKLVSAKDHLFARWDTPDERFNIECTNGGLVTESDDRYRAWRDISPTEEERLGCLRSMTPREELKSFVFERGHCLADNQRFVEAAETFAIACSLSLPGHMPLGTLIQLMEDWVKWLRNQMPPPWPTIRTWLTDRRYPWLPVELEADLLELKALTNLIVSRQHAVELSAEQISAYIQGSGTDNDKCVTPAPQSIEKRA